ncbi:MAG: amidohydrolase family protein, partial [Acidimicrobiales bacterium]
LHVGSSGMYPLPPGGGVALAATLFGQLALGACAEWLWSEHPLRHPSLKIAMSEGGIGWVAMLLDRLDNVVDRSGYGQGWDIRPAEVLQRNFWFCTIDDPSTIDTRHRIGVDHIMVETDYPHGDSTWPNTQEVIQRAWGHLPAGELRQLCSTNAAALYRHPLPAHVLPADPP